MNDSFDDFAPINDDDDPPVSERTERMINQIIRMTEILQESDDLNEHWELLAFFIKKYLLDLQCLFAYENLPMEDFNENTTRFINFLIECVVDILDENEKIPWKKMIYLKK